MAQQIVFYQYYPHYMGSINRRVLLDPMLLAMLITLGADTHNKNQPEGYDPVYDLDDMIEDLVKEAKCGSIHCLDVAVIDDVGKIERALDKKGWYFGEWEEGSFYFCYEEFEETAKNKLRKHESQFMDLDD